MRFRLQPNQNFVAALVFVVIQFSFKMPARYPLSIMQQMVSKLASQITEFVIVCELVTKTVTLYINKSLIIRCKHPFYSCEYNVNISSSKSSSSQYRAGAHNSGRATPILGLCSGVITDQFIFSIILQYFFRRQYKHHPVSMVR